MAKFGLVGRNIGYSFSKSFFTAKFEKENSRNSYENFDIESIEELPKILEKATDLKGLNVTIPYKETVIQYLDKLDREAEKIGAVNTIKFDRKGRLIGYNTDHYGFARALSDYLPIKQKTALILGTGGASKAISYVLDAMDFEYHYVSRQSTAIHLNYSELNREIIEDHILIVNTTPLGTFPKVEEYPRIPYEYINADHLLFDLIYNPLETEFMKRGFASGARVSNGLKMLEYQALKAWSIWNS